MLVTAIPPHLLESFTVSQFTSDIPLLVSLFLPHKKSRRIVSILAITQAGSLKHARKYTGTTERLKGTMTLFEKLIHSPDIFVNNLRISLNVTTVVTSALSTNAVSLLEKIIQHYSLI